MLSPYLRMRPACFLSPVTTLYLPLELFQTLFPDCNEWRMAEWKEVRTSFVSLCRRCAAESSRLNRGTFWGGVIHLNVSTCDFFLNERNVSVEKELTLYRGGNVFVRYGGRSAP